MRRHRLRKRYGRAALGSGKKAHVVMRMPNVVVWKGGGGFFMWSPGGRLRFGLSDPRKVGSSMPGAIAHPTADGNYRTEKEAAAAIRRFLNTP